MTDLRFTIGTDASLRIEPIGDFADWTVASAQWMSVLFGGILSEGAAGAAFLEGSVTQVVAQVVGPEGQTATLTSPVVTVVAGGSSVRVEAFVEGENFEFTAPFAEGAALFATYDTASEVSRDAGVLFADGREVDYTLDEIDRSLVRASDEGDLFDAFEWSSRTTDFDDEGRINNYKLRKPDHKRETVKRLHELNFNVVAAGDSYNDTTMLGEAEQGILFCPPQNVIDEFPQFPVATSYDDLRREIDSAMAVMPAR